VTGTFEEVNDAKGEGVEYLREMANAVAEESAAAALEGRSIDMAAMQNRMKMVAANPSAVMGAQRAYWSELDDLRVPKSSSSASQPPQAYDAPQPYDAPEPYDSTNTAGRYRSAMTTRE
jgi:hypothetical protein